MNPALFPRLLALSLFGLTTACAAGGAPAAGGGSAALSTGSPAPLSGYDWHLTTEDGSARLAYGIAESDELKLGLVCGAGSGTVEVTSTGPSGTQLILLESGGETERLQAVGEASELTAGDILTAEAPADAPVFQRFRRLGWLAQWRGDVREAYAAHPGSGTGVERFFALCD